MACRSLLGPLASTRERIVSLRPSILLVLLFTWHCALAQNTLTVVSAADYVAYPLAPDSIVSIFAANIATGVFLADKPPPAPLPIGLGGVSATITDVSGNTLPIGLIAITPSQVNAVLPSGLQAGVAVVNLTTSSGSQISGKVTLAAVAPSLFTADQTGGWLAAALVVTAHADGSQTIMNSIAKCTSNPVWNGSTWSGCVPIPINLGSSADQVVLELFGTGFRGVNSIIALCPNCGYAPGVSVVAGPQCNNPATCTTNYLPVLYAGPQGAGVTGSNYGLDQINILLPHYMAGSGPISLTVGAISGYFNGTGVGADANTVYVDIQ